MYDFKKYVIEPAVKDINQHSNFTVTWTQRKSGRNVTHLIFQFADKEPNQAAKKTVRKTSKVAQTLTAPSAEIQALIYPQSLSQPERDKCALLLAQIPPQDAQGLLDTLEAAIGAGQVKKSTLALLGGVIKRYHAGDFDASVGMPIAIEREQSAKRQREREINELYGEIKCLERLYAVAKDKSLKTQLQAAQAKLKSYEAMLKTSQT